MNSSLRYIHELGIEEGKFCKIEIDLSPLLVCAIREALRSPQKSPFSLVSRSMRTTIGKLSITQKHEISPSTRNCTITIQLPPLPVQELCYFCIADTVLWDFERFSCFWFVNCLTRRRFASCRHLLWHVRRARCISRKKLEVVFTFMWPIGKGYNDIEWMQQ